MKTNEIKKTKIKKTNVLTEIKKTIILRKMITETVLCAYKTN